MNTIKIRTLYDCTQTGTVGRPRQESFPLTDRAGFKINSLEDWSRSRNKQRNFESLIQVVSLRTQPFDITTPTFNIDNNCWEFSFVIEFDNIYSIGDDDLAGLRADFSNVPMITNLEEKLPLSGFIVVDGENQNIWFEYFSNK